MTTLPETAVEPTQAMLNALRNGRHAKAVELARPLAEKGNADALYVLGFTHETGQGAEASREKALEYYRKAAASNQKDATYRLALILLASDKEDERTQARKVLEDAAKADIKMAGRILGEAYLRGRLTPEPAPEQAILWWRRAGDAGDIPSLILLASLREGQFGFAHLKNLPEAVALYGKAAGLGDAGAMATLGSRLLNGDASIRDEKKGREWLKKAVDEKEYSAYLALGDFEENIKKNLKAALTEYERGKDVGQVDCMLRAANFYLEGRGVEKDAARGIGILSKAAEGGHPVANFQMAIQYLSGDEPNIAVGYKHLLAAASGNLADAQNELGLFYLAGKLGSSDASAGVAWLTRAAQNGSVAAQNNLAALYESGSAGMTRNLENAGQLYTLAANQGHGPATLALARLLSENTGVKPNLVKAWALASLASERGEANAGKLVDEIYSKLDAKQRIEAKQELAQIKSGKPAPAPATPEAPKEPKKIK